MFGSLVYAWGMARMGQPYLVVLASLERPNWASQLSLALASHPRGPRWPELANVLPPRFPAVARSRAARASLAAGIGLELGERVAVGGEPDGFERGAGAEA